MRQFVGRERDALIAFVKSKLLLHLPIVVHVLTTGPVGFVAIALRGRSIAHEDETVHAKSLEVERAALVPTSGIRIGQKAMTTRSGRAPVNTSNPYEV